ncbi:type II secretion system F family protein [Paeniglutamicibacter psychrophenolicus]|uniref:type II secretion system F family protein n=1 Tax=Paeniglutamicibacter psychrophenolicus TaxID=257454 RepID=UPI0027889D06|nr:type II secretion system F family protein [Paeniglutamicibacter psychrophenolicus]MDQ0092541.1 tight adherence protein C [Paeniglutamicibacter psychrophenolicus]
MGITAIGWISIALVVLPLSFIVWGLVSVDRNQLVLVRQNLSRSAVTPGEEIIGSGDNEFAALARRLTPGSYAAKLDRMLSMAGRTASWPLDRVLMMKPLLALGGALLGFLLFSSNPGTGIFVLGVALTAFGYFLPDLLVYNNGIKRQQAIQLELPNTLDQLLISVEAGLGLESAMARVAAGGQGPLAEEMGRTLQEMQVGRSRREAYAAMADRSSVADLKSFVRAVVQADKYGIGIARVLRTQAGQMRIKRRQRAEETAMKLPVKILFPLLVFIFPTLFIVILGPAAINIMKSGIFG